MICQDCGREIPVSNPQKVLCIQCKYNQTREKYRKQRVAKRIKRHLERVKCPACEKIFEKRTKDQKFCNDECRIIMENKKFNLKWVEEDIPTKKKAYPKYRKPFDISNNYFNLKKFSACRG